MRLSHPLANLFHLSLSSDLFQICSSKNRKIVRTCRTTATGSDVVTSFFFGFILIWSTFNYTKRVKRIVHTRCSRSILEGAGINSYFCKILFSVVFLQKFGKKLSQLYHQFVKLILSGLNLIYNHSYSCIVLWDKGFSYPSGYHVHWYRCMGKDWHVKKV